MQFKFRRGNIFKIENGVSTQITREEYEALSKNKKEWKSWNPPEIEAPVVTENGQDFVE